jgi:hypothetical protein
MGMRRLIALVALCALGGCGGQVVDGGLTGTQPPRSSQQPRQGPPDAYLTLNGQRKKMAMGSYCWTSLLDDGTGVGRCGDSAGWDMIKDIPQLTGTAGDDATLELGFDPTRPVQVSIGHRRLQLQPGRTLTFRLPAKGIVEVFANVEGGDVSYGLRVA